MAQHPELLRGRDQRGSDHHVHSSALHRNSGMRLFHMADGVPGRLCRSAREFSARPRLLSAFVDSYFSGEETFTANSLTVSGNILFYRMWNGSDANRLAFKSGCPMISVPEGRSENSCIPKTPPGDGIAISRDGASHSPSIKELMTES